MQVGDLVKVHWGNCDWSGEEGVEWGYAPGVITGEIQYWNADARANKSPVCGDVEIMFRGERVKYNLGRLEVVSASR